MYRSPAAHARLLLLASSACFPAVGQRNPKTEKHQLEYAFIAEHKTGMEFAFLLNFCMVSFEPPSESPSVRHSQVLDMVDRGLLGGPEDIFVRRGTGKNKFMALPQWGKIVYMVRNPYEMVRSNYLYSMDCWKKEDCLKIEEPMLEPASKMLRWREALLSKKPRRNETYNAYLHRLSMADGIKAVLAGHAYWVLRRMEMILFNNFVQERVLTVCLNDIFRSFNKTVQSILRHLGVAADTKLWSCLETLDPSRHRPAHGTHDVDEEKRREVMSLARAYDAKYFDRVFGSSLFTSLCPQDGLP